MLRTLIVDDERLARQKIRMFLEARSDVSVAGEAGSVSEAIAMVERERPDLVLLDIQMPGGDGFDVVRALPSAHAPAVVFITAHGDYAIRAFEVAAVDYLLKPFDRARFNEAIDRAKKSAPRDLRNAFFPVKKRDRTILVAVRDVDWIEAEGKYVRLHVRDQSYLVRDAIAAVEARLDRRQFVRIHRSTIVNLRRVTEIRDDSLVVLTDGTQLTMSRRFRARVREATGLNL
ncbi:MAG TPA: LytTR family DNA-binding domain-containing protein [Thermoanaerobaculia bacterium]|nr:LytTR family DNA-binding domain-containing protein [Thermoanaerobaculia bacterium]